MLKLMVYTNLIQTQLSCKKVCGLQQGHCEKRCEIQSGRQEMAVMEANSKNFNPNNSGEFVLPSPRFTTIWH